MNGLKKLVFCSLGCMSLLYAFGGPRVAEIGFQLPFLNFPVFIGEILLILCLIYLIIKWRSNQYKIKFVHLLLIFYSFWILSKALLGYFQFSYEPMAFRHAALFYYLFFAVIGYYSFDRAFFNQSNIIFILIIMLMALKFDEIFSYHRFSYLLIFILLAFNLKDIKLRWLFILLMMIFFPFHNFFICARALFISFLGAVVSIILGIIIISYKKSFNNMQSRMFIAGIIVVVFFSSYINKERLKAMISFKEIKSSFNHYDAIVKKSMGTFALKEIHPQIYSPYRFNEEITTTSIVNTVKDSNLASNSIERKIIENSFKEVQKKVNALTSVTVSNFKKREISLEQSSNLIESSVKHIVDDELSTIRAQLELNNKDGRDLDQKMQGIGKQLNQIVRAGLIFDLPTDKPRSIETDNNNLLFRVFIWRDMIEEIINNKAWFGLSWGHAQRSKSIEILGWAVEEWSRDGWITPHNSYLHMIYRAGILGVFLIIVILYLLIAMIKKFLKLQSFKGIILVSILIYWMLLSCFLVILELPYNAIPFWTLFGYCFAYAKQIERGTVGDKIL